MARNPDKRRCSRTNADGTPCTNYAQRGRDVCRSHDDGKSLPNPQGAEPGNRNAVKHGYYNEFFTAEDLAALVTMPMGVTLEEEIAIVRLGIRRLAARLAADEPTHGLVEVASALFTGAGRVAALLKAQRAISGDAADGISGAIAQALHELGNEWGIEL